MTEVQSREMTVEDLTGRPEDAKVRTDPEAMQGFVEQKKGSRKSSLGIGIGIIATVVILVIVIIVIVLTTT